MTEMKIDKTNRGTALNGILRIMIFLSAMVLVTMTVSASSFTITSLGTLPGGLNSAAQDINDNGQIVGYSTSSSVCHAFLWENGVMTDLGTLPGGTYSYAFGINDNGEIVGQSDSSSGQRAFLWENDVMTDLGTLPGGTYSTALDINDNGEIVGQSESSSGRRAFLWKNGVMNDLGTLPGGSNSFANGINDNGEIAGQSESSSGVHAFLWKNGVMNDLGTLPGGTYSTALDINDNGQVVGYSGSSSGIHAFLWENGVMTDLGTLPGGTYSYAYGINNNGQVVSYSGSSSGVHAFLWKNGVMTDLGTLPGGSDSNAFGINDNGQIVGTTSYNSYKMGTLWTLLPTTPTITWNPDSLTYGTALGSSQLNAIALDPTNNNADISSQGTFTYTENEIPISAGTILSAGQHNLLVTFTPDSDTDYTEATQTAIITVDKATPTITWNNPADISNITALSSAQLNAVATDPISGATIDGTFTYDPSAGTILSLGLEQPLSATFSPTGDYDTNYTKVEKTVYINVLTPVQSAVRSAQQLTAKIPSLVSSDVITPTQESSLDNKLKKAIENLNQVESENKTNNKDKTVDRQSQDLKKAENELNAFSNQVNSMIKSDKRTEEQKNALQALNKEVSKLSTALQTERDRIEALQEDKKSGNNKDPKSER